MAGKITHTPLPESPTVESAGEFGLFIRSLRTQHQMRIDDAAALCKVSVQLLSDLENGRRSVGLDKALSVARSLGVAILAVPRSELPQTLSCMQKNEA
jgi:transcriptional regulator with XRE-family HTH domain